MVSVRISGIEWFWISNIEKASWTVDDSRGTQIIQMHNGVGKTTTLYLLQSIFTGIHPSKILEEDILFARCRYKGPKFDDYKKKDGPSRISVSLEIDGEDWILGLEVNSEENTSEFFTVNYMRRAYNIFKWSLTCLERE